MSFFMTDRIMRMAATPSTIQGSSSDMVFASVFAILPMPFNALMYKSLLSDLDFDIVFSDLGFGFVGSECSLVLSYLVRFPVTDEEEATSCSGDLFERRSMIICLAWSMRLLSPVAESNDSVKQVKVRHANFL